MKRRTFVKTLGAGAAALALPHLSHQPEAAEAADPARRKPNVVFILTDDMRWDCMSCAGHPFLKTPNLDRIAAEGARFANYFGTTSLCSPSRASMLSGLYAHTHRVIDNFTEYPPNFVSFPMRLQAEGYETAYIGKWHMGENNEEKRPGFDYWASHKGQADYNDTPFNINGRREVLKGYYTTRVTDLALDWMKQDRGAKPFCLILGHKAPHTPYTPEPKYAHLYDNVEIKYPDSAFHLEDKPEWIKQRLPTWHGIYGPLYGFRKDFPDTRPESVKDFAAFLRSYTATINSIDDSVGRVYQALRESGQLDNTLLIFASDNGMFAGEHGMTDKRAMHEESIRIPMLARLPKSIKPGTVVREMVLNIDLAPSVLDICGAQPLASIHGKSWKALLAGGAAGGARDGRDGRDTRDQSKESGGGAAGWRKSWFYEYNYEKQFPYTPNVRGVRTDEWKYMHYPHGDGRPDRHKAELYNLKNDPMELKNLIDDPASAGKLAELKKELARLMQETGALPDKMPLDEGVKTALPDKAIR